MNSAGMPFALVLRSLAIRPNEADGAAGPPDPSGERPQRRRATATGATSGPGVCAAMGAAEALKTLFALLHVAADDPRRAALVVVPHALRRAGAGPPLTEAERRRAARIVSPARRDAFETGRLLLHRLASSAASARPIELAYGRHGKPSLPGGPQFCLSHASGCSGIAVHAQQAIGLDLESPARLTGGRELVPLLAHPAEARWLAAAGEADLTALLLRAWMRKEALLKARGCGFACAPQAIDTRLGEPCPLIDAPEGRWRLSEVPLPDSGTSAVLALPEIVERIELAVIVEIARESGA